MGIKKTIGGDRLGSGNRMKEEMHNFYRSNKNLSTTFASTMAPGVLYPCYTNIGIKGDTFDIDLKAFVRTLPTIGPLYGSFKMQVDIFQVPFRLYQGLLHNNPIDIAKKMDKVMLPRIQLAHKVNGKEIKENSFVTQIHETALLRYLNISGIGKPQPSLGENDSQMLFREFMAIPTLAYYDIFKNYYANKQEENAYVITPNPTKTAQIGEEIVIKKGTQQTTDTIVDNAISAVSPSNGIDTIEIYGKNLDPQEITLQIITQTNSIQGTIAELKNQGKIKYTIQEDKTKIVITRYYSVQCEVLIELKNLVTPKDIYLAEFPLQNIDDMRYDILKHMELGVPYRLDGAENISANLPYKTLLYQSDTFFPNTFALNGLVVKCYQSDMFNNWLDTEWINEITETSAIDVSNGSFTIDMLNFKKKLYDHLNRLALSGGTYDDWQEATYGDRVWGKSEKPIYCGGLSAEVVFDEVISTAATSEQALGTIGGQGMLQTRKGGHVTIKVGEASVIMAIVSLTPRLFYTQGNAWYNTELKTMDDLHKPMFDRIGFQDLIVEQMAWWDATADYRPGVIDQDFLNFTRSSAGKQPAWLNYATDVDRAYGDFARKEGTNYMILARNYEQGDNGEVKDVTTYIDPSKFNYAFNYAALDAQNFWTFIKFNIHARRKMSNTQIPNV